MGLRLSACWWKIRNPPRCISSAASLSGFPRTERRGFFCLSDVERPDPLTAAFEAKPILRPCGFECLATTHTFPLTGARLRLGFVCIGYILPGLRQAAFLNHHNIRLFAAFPALGTARRLSYSRIYASRIREILGAAKTAFD